MTDTGQVPGEGLPESAGMVEQPGVPAHGAYPYLSETTAEDEDLLLPGSHGAWGNEVVPPAPEPVVEAVHEPGPHEMSGRDSGSVDLGGVRLPNQTRPTAPTVPIPPVTPRRPLHLGPPIPDASASPVRSLADRGAVGSPVRQPGLPTPGPEYLDLPQHGEVAVPQAATAWTAAQAQAPAPAQVSTEAPAAETVVPAAQATETVGVAQAAVARVATEAAATAGAPQGAQESAPGAQEAVHEAAYGGHVPSDGAATQVPGAVPGVDAGQVPGAAQGSETAGEAPTAAVAEVPGAAATGEMPEAVAPGEAPTAAAGHVPGPAATGEAPNAAVGEVPGAVAAGEAPTAAAGHVPGPVAAGEVPTAGAGEVPGAAPVPGAEQVPVAGYPQDGGEVPGAAQAPGAGELPAAAPAAEAGQVTVAAHDVSAGEAPDAASGVATAETTDTAQGASAGEMPGAVSASVPVAGEAAAAVAAGSPAGQPVSTGGSPDPGAVPEAGTVPDAAQASAAGHAPGAADGTDPAQGPEGVTAADGGQLAKAAAGDGAVVQGSEAVAQEAAQTPEAAAPEAEQVAAENVVPEAVQGSGAPMADAAHVAEATAPEAAPAPEDHVAAAPEAGQAAGAAVADAAQVPGAVVAEAAHVPAPPEPGADQVAEAVVPGAAQAPDGTTPAPAQPLPAPEAMPSAPAPEAAQAARPADAVPAPDAAAQPTRPTADAAAPAEGASTAVSPEEPPQPVDAEPAVPDQGDHVVPDALPAPDLQQAQAAEAAASVEPDAQGADPAAAPETDAVHIADSSAQAPDAPQTPDAAEPADAPQPLAVAADAGVMDQRATPEEAAHGEAGPEAHAPQPFIAEPAGPQLRSQPDQSVGQFVPVDGSVPTAPHLAPTPSQPGTLPMAEHQAPTVPAPRDGDAELVQHAEDLDTRAADQEDQEEESAAAVEETRQSTGPAAPAYDDAEREAVLKVMRERRDIRNGFRSDPIPHEVLLRVLEAAHTAPSVGHSQPWDFVVIRSAETRRTMHELAMRQREAYAKSLPKGRAKQFKELKIEAILDTPVNIVVTADPTRGGRHTLGRHTQPQMAPYSSALAVENLWLAARAEGLGVGWVSFFDEREMVRALGLPEHLEVVAYLCVGYVDEFPEEPELMQAGWSKRRPLSWVVHEETYGRRALPGEEPHDLLAETVAQIRPLDAKALGEAWERQKRMTKPAGALGMLEIISAQLSGLSRQCPPPIPEPAAVAIFAGDHGVHAQGVTPWPQEVTAQMVANFLGGGAVCNAFAGQVGAEVCVVDVGVAADLPATPGLLPRKVRAGTSDMTTGPAMTREEAKQAIEVGIETARDLVAAGNRALLTGEMGIANTTASAALISVFTDTDPSEVTGRGTGINDETLARKTEVVRRALELHQPDPADPIGVLAAIGGFEHAAMVGLLLGGASLRTPVILDGVSAGAAALVARAIAPEVLAACIAGHRSAEPGHVAALNKLGLRPLVDLDLRLGEGTGALLALPLVQSTARAMHEVATFDSAGVTEK